MGPETQSAIVEHLQRIVLVGDEDLGRKRAQAVDLQGQAARNEDTETISTLQGEIQRARSHRDTHKKLLDSAIEAHPTETIVPGAVVELSIDDGPTSEAWIVTNGAASIAQINLGERRIGLISLESPLGKTLHGHQAGETINYVAGDPPIDHCSTITKVS